ncbi:Alpha-ketoglutarate-dependent sulfonate dioxygenase [Hypsizygus marmoreus]|uniref:Alpha-ketoglutarate-dependent sulfonate dioxygenase n=1 Tax=Hypsizygus marmoreus TaxID=39966 RepID=A0A369JQ22_HYPMA|nr:Alpha-ketoglutarate-dependent sulfonate dioxygenase [Hypsizygus marmoreus]
MAPSVSQLETTQAPVETVAKQVTKGTLNAQQEKEDVPSYPFYYPIWDLEEKFPPTEIFEHSDPGLRADPAKPNLLNASAKVHHISPYLGTELEVVVFRDQDFKDIGPDRQIAIARHFGPIQRHPTSGNVKGYPEFHVVYRDAKRDPVRDYQDRINFTSWHSDVSYEKQPPGTTFFFILDQPETGGDTLFLSQVEAYNRLSPEFQKRLEGLKAVHSAVPQAENSLKRGGVVRREPVESEHPIVRVHPVTGEKALFVNPNFTKRVVGFKQEESEYLLGFLFDHIAKGADFHVRGSYKPGTVVVWDNRVTVHSSTPDFARTIRRHAVRLTPQAEVPIPA